MILSVDELMVLPEFMNEDADLLQKKLDALEILIRKYTNNNFQNRNIRFYADSEGKVEFACYNFCATIT